MFRTVHSRRARICLPKSIRISTAVPDRNEMATPISSPTNEISSFWGERNDALKPISFCWIRQISSKDSFPRHRFRIRPDHDHGLELRSHSKPNHPSAKISYTYSGFWSVFRQESFECGSAESELGSPNTRSPKLGRVRLCPHLRGEEAMPHAKAKSKKYWSAEVTERSDALDLEPGVFTWDDPKRIACSLKESAEASPRRKGTPLQSAMSMLNFYMNRAGKSLSRQQRDILERAKDELRQLFRASGSVRQRVRESVARGRKAGAAAARPRESTPSGQAQT
jgi:Protein of unknown function (DUF3175)